MGLASNTPVYNSQNDFKQRQLSRFSHDSERADRDFERADRDFERADRDF